MTKPTDPPWTATDMGGGKDGVPMFIRITGPNGERICDILPHASVGGVGIEAARANAALILEAGNGKKPI